MHVIGRSRVRVAFVVCPRMAWALADGWRQPLTATDGRAQRARLHAAASWQLWTTASGHKVTHTDGKSPDVHGITQKPKDGHGRRNLGLSPKSWMASIVFRTLTHGPGRQRAAEVATIWLRTPMFFSRTTAGFRIKARAIARQRPTASHSTQSHGPPRPLSIVCRKRRAGARALDDVRAPRATLAASSPHKRSQTLRVATRA